MVRDHFTLVRWALGWPGLVLSVLWGFAEATLFFIIPDVLITFTAMFSIRRSLLQLAATTLGAAVGGLLMYSWALHGSAATQAVEGVPFVRRAMVERVCREYAQSGPLAMVERPMSGIPYKVFAVSAPSFLSLPRFVAWSFPARLERFLLTWTPFAAFGLLIRARRADFTRLAIALHAGFWVSLYAIYWSIV